MKSFLHLATAAFGLVLALPACAQSTLSVTVKGNDELSSTNSGQVTLNGSMTGGSIGGTNNSTSLAAQGASSQYSEANVTYDSFGNAVGTSGPVSVSGVSFSGSNSGSVTVNASVNGTSVTGSNGSISVSGIGMANSLSIKSSSR